MVSRSIKLLVLDLMIKQNINHRPSLVGVSREVELKISKAGGIKNICKELNIPSRLELDSVLERGRQAIADREEQAHLQNVREAHRNDIY